MHEIISLLLWINQTLSASGCLLSAGFFLLLFCIIKLVSAQKKQKLQPVFSGQDLSTELNLARAFLEMGKKQESAEKLLLVIQQGSTAQREEARRLMKGL